MILFNFLIHEIHSIYRRISMCRFQNVIVFFIFHESDSLDQNNLIMGRWSDLPYVHQMPQWECVVCLCSCTVCDDWVALRSVAVALFTNLHFCRLLLHYLHIYILPLVFSLLTFFFCFANFVLKFTKILITFCFRVWFVVFMYGFTGIYIFKSL